MIGSMSDLSLTPPKPVNVPDAGSAGLRIPLSMAQKTMAKRMLESAREIPQFSVSRDLDGDRLAAIREEINAGIGKEGLRVSVTALLLWLSAQALKKHPRLNSRFDGDAVIQFSNVNLAVAMDTPYGLVVPVIRKVDDLTVAETGQALKELAARAAAKRLSISDFTDGTFTVSNLGMMGVTAFQPMVNPPQCAILGIAAPRVAVRLAPDGSVVPVRLIGVTVAADHRIVDGAEVARFLETLAASVEETQDFPWKKNNTDNASKNT